MKFPGMSGKKAKVANAPEEGGGTVAAAEAEAEAADSADSAAADADAGAEAPPTDPAAESTKEGKGKGKTIQVKPSKKRGPEFIGKLASKETPPPTDDEKADATPVQEGPLLHGVLTTADVEHIRQLFEASDDDGSGHVDEKEFEGLVKKLCKEDKTRAPGHKDLLAAFTEADVDGGGHVDLDEFMALYARVKKGEVKGLGGGFFGKKKKLFTPEELASKRLTAEEVARGVTLVHGTLTPKDVSHLQELFHGTDEDESGYIDEEEFCMLVKRLCKEDKIKPPSNKDLDKAFADADADKSGNVDMGEFTSLYAKVKKGEVIGLGGGGMFGKVFGGTPKQHPTHEPVPTGESNEDTAKLATTEASTSVKTSEEVAEASGGVLTAEDVVHMRELFNATDADKSGHIDEKEFEGLVKKLCKEDKTPVPKHKDLLAAFKEADTDGGGAVCMGEFTSLYIKVKKGEVKGLGGGGFFSFGRNRKQAEAKPPFVLSAEDEARLRELFNDADDDASGQIDLPEFKKLIKKLCKEEKQAVPNDKDLTAAFKDADADGGGHVDFDEFKSLYSKVRNGEVKGLGGGGLFGGFFFKASKVAASVVDAAAHVGAETSAGGGGGAVVDGGAVVETLPAKPPPTIEELAAGLTSVFVDYIRSHHNHFTVSAVSQITKDRGFMSQVRSFVEMGMAQDEALMILTEFAEEFYQPDAMADRFVRDLWGGFWGPFMKNTVEPLSAALRVTACIRRKIAQDRVNAMREAAAEEARNVDEAYRQYLRMKAERERIRRQVCKTLAQGMAADGIRRMRIPTSCLRVQCWWRGVRVRARLERYRDWLRRRAKWLQERERVRMALGKVYESQADVRARQAIVERRIYGRDEFEHSGWQPDYKADAVYNIFDFIDHPPSGQTYGVRSHKVTLMPKSEYESRLITEDENSWVGVPVAVQDNRRSNATSFGPALRFDTTVLPESTYGKTGAAAKPFDADVDVEASAGAGVVIDAGAGLKEKDPFYKVSYNWVPAPLVAGAVLQSEDPMAELDERPADDGGCPEKMARTATQDLMRRPMQAAGSPRRKMRK